MGLKTTNLVEGTALPVLRGVDLHLADTLVGMRVTRSRRA